MPQVSPLTDTELTSAILAEVGPTLKRIRSTLSNTLFGCGLSLTQYHVLMLLDDQGPLPMSRIADAADVSLSNLTGVVDRMEEHGLVERVRVPDDRRIVLVRPTEQGSRLMAELGVVRADAMARILGRLDRVQLERLWYAVMDLKGAADAASSAMDRDDRKDQRGR